MKINKCRSCGSDRLEDILNLSNQPWCLSEETMILTNDGYKPISEINTGDVVVTHLGNIKKVINVFRRKYVGEIRKINGCGMLKPLIITSEHQIYSIDKSITSRNFKSYGEYLNSFAKWEKSEKINKNDFLLCPNFPINEDSDINTNKMFLLGCYIGDGNLHGKQKNGNYSQIRFFIDKKRLIEKISELMKMEFGILPTIKHHDKYSVLSFFSVEICKFFSKYCGNPKKKQINSALLAVNPELLKYFIDGWQQTDGSFFIQKGKYISHCNVVYTSELSLAYSLKIILEKLQIPYHISINKRKKEIKIGGRTLKNVKPSYGFGWCEKQNKNRRQNTKMKYVNNYKVVKLNINETEQYNGYVWNLEVEDDNSYIAEGISVHNCNNFLTVDEIGKEEYYPLQLVYCHNCTLLQLNFTVPKETMFKNHTYLSGTTKTLTEHFFNLAASNQKFATDSNSLIVDIGGNDGTQLLQYKKLGYENLLNIESADNIAKISLENGIDTANAFFNEQEAESIVNTRGKAKIINASGVFFHLEELHSVIKGIKKLLAPDGIFVIQFMYAGDMIDNMSFDMIYHEHLCYYTLKSLENLLLPYGFMIFDAYHSPIHSGSIIAKVMHETSISNSITDRYFETIKKDNEYDLRIIKRFAEKVIAKKYELKNFLMDLKSKGKKIYAYGAPAKGNTLLNYMEIDNTLLDKVVEVNPLKIRLLTPGSHIRIEREDKADLPDYYLLLSHNFFKEIIHKNLDIINKGVKFIVPFPEIKVYP